MKLESLPPKLTVTNVDVWNATGVARERDVHVENGVVTAIVAHGARPVTGVAIPGKGAVLMPAGVDNQVHLRTPGQFHKETPEKGLAAALYGGVGAVLTMPNTKPVIDSVDVVDEAKRALGPAELATGVKVFLSAALTRGQEGQVPVDFEPLMKAGVKAFTDDGRGVARDDIMRTVIRNAQGLGAPILQHAEVPGHGCALAAGPVAKTQGLKPYPREAEIDMVRRDLEMLRECPTSRYHVLHVSCLETVGLVETARRQGLLASCEVTPHHLLFSSNDVNADDTSFKMNPPLRDTADRDFLQQALADGRIDFAATDHAPHEPAAKGADFQGAAFGTTGLEALLKTLLKLHLRGLLSPERVVDVFSAAPARFLGIDGTYGAVAEGQPFRAILVDVDAPEAPLGRDELQSLSLNSVFVGLPLPGTLKAHFTDGQWLRAPNLAVRL